ncbi:hypothetical protein F3Y22_tig00110781pilonHSYRG00026 [Hibiscus syriacus]|uniref:Uncharacterized protein n=1 Tax=Hibiscus syriacus TaxID=106335 RepID=A0A6A2ZTF5_HIBSY|nr:hypothetical protein F3Y22_tig00110781pilonHSYRG00026 [Hibiscus syriacus]
MISTETIRTIVGIAGNVVSFFLFLPRPHIFRIWKAKSVQDFKPDQYLATVLNCMMWVFYGLPMVHPDSLLIITINAIGLVIESIYSLLLIYSDNKKRGMVIKTKSVKYMPYTLSLFNVLCGIIWMVYALLKFDINVLVPNVVGCMSGMMQLILYAWFYKTTKWDDDEKASAQKVQLSEI